MIQWQAVVYPVSLTSLMYAGSLVMTLLNSLREHSNDGEGHSSNCTNSGLQIFIDKMLSIASDVSTWRNYFVVSIFTIWTLLLDPCFFRFHCNPPIFKVETLHRFVRFVDDKFYVRVLFSFPELSCT